MEDGKRLDEFLAWAVAKGLEEERVADYRRIAAELFAQAEGRRVNESHILALCDAYADRPAADAAVELINEIGEAVLRFQAQGKGKAPLGLPTNRPRRPAPPAPPSESSPPITPPRVEPLPPSVPTPPVDEVISFVMPERPSSVPPATRTPRPSVRREGPLQFRCPKCKNFVTTDAAGLCPTCGTAPPQLTKHEAAPAAPGPVVTPFRVLLVLLLLGAIAALVGPNLLEKVRFPSENAAGPHTWPTLGLKSTFPPGWRHLRKDDRVGPLPGGIADVVPDGATVRASTFYKGDRASRPDRTLVLTVSERSAAEPDALFTPDNAAGAIAALTHRSLKLDRCEPFTAPLGAGIHCTGVADGRGAVAWLLAGPGQLVAMAMISDVPGDPTAVKDGDDIASSLAPP